MALLPILHFPDPRLQKVAAPIERIDDEVRRLAADMAETMYAAPGIGLAATQVDVHRRLIVIDISEAHDHHPDILVRYRRVTLTLCTHDAGHHLTELDLDVATAVERLPTLVN